MAIPTTYTGQNSGAAPIFSGGKTEAAISQGLQGMLQARKADVSLKRQEAKEFQDALAVDPIQVMDTQAMQMQAQKLEGLNSKWTEIMKQKGGNLTMEDKALMQSDIRAITAWQGNLHAKQQAFLQDSQRFSINQHDQAARDAAIQKVTSGGLEDYVPGEMLQPKPLSFSDYMGRIAKDAKMAPRSDRTITQVGGKEVVVTKKIWGATPEESEKNARGVFFSSILGDQSGQMLSAAMRRFEDADVDTKKKYLDNADTNNNGRWDPDEQENAVLNYVWDVDGKPQYLSEARKEDFITTTATDRKAAREESALQIQNLVSTGYTDKSTKTGWDAVNNYPTSKLGVVEEGIALTELPSIRAGWGFMVPISAIDGGVPKGAFVQGDKVLARGQVISSDGRVELNVYTGKVKEAPDQDIAAMEYEEGSSKFVLGDDGKYYTLDRPSAFDKAVTSKWSKIEGLLSQQYPRVDEAVNYKIEQGDWNFEQPKGSSKWDQYKRN